MIGSRLRSLARKLKSAVVPKDVVGRANLHVPTERLGSDYGGWWVHPGTLGRDSVVYSFGVGEDISFDLALIRRFGCTVHAFDPTPRSIDWVRSQHPPREFVMHGYGLAARDGTISFYPPKDPRHVSHSVVERGADAREKLPLPVKRLSTIMSELGHARVDLLKMDIEGSEYDVLEDLVASGTPVTQLLVEYHHRFPEVGRATTEQSLSLLERGGYGLFRISESAEEYSFLRRAEGRGAGAGGGA